MGVYEKLGIRKVAINLGQFINWVRQYGYQEGSGIHKSLKKAKENYFVINEKSFKNPVLLRDNFSDKAIFFQVFFEKQYYLETISIPDARYIIDAGANIGLASIYFANQYPEANIISIEPQTDNFCLLQKNTGSYKNISCVNAALWHKEEFISIVNPDSLSASFMVEATAKAETKAVTINSILEQFNWNRIDILKIDIEGAEKEVFSGNTDWLGKVKLLIIELHDNYKPDCTKTFFKAIESYSYQAYFHHENIFILFQS
jgi:FkbM family methyltransferase